MKKLLIVAGILIACGIFILPIGKLMIMWGLKNSDKGPAYGMAMKGIRIHSMCLRHRTAALAMEKAVKTWPTKVDKARVTYRLGLSWEKAGDLNKAESYYKAYIAAYPNHDWHAQAKRRLGMLEAKR